MNHREGEALSYALVVVQLALMASAAAGIALAFLAYWVSGSPDAAGVVGLLGFYLTFAGIAVVRARRRGDL